MSEVLTEVSVATEWLQKIRNYREKPHFLKETTLKAPENTPSYTIDYLALIREGVELLVQAVLLQLLNNQ
ncbi:MAG: hypothetical protein K2N15_05995 [Lachnospiraceae bacterium]|nr:hypothetical protein [Lachnospiraceae bacterium]